MPKIQPPGEYETSGTLDLNPDLRDMTKTLRDNLTARTTADVYSKLAQPSDSSLPVMQGLGEALGGMAKGWQGLAEMQNMTQKQFLEQMQQGSPSGGGVEEMMKWMFLYRMMREMTQEESPKKTEDDAPTWRDFLAEQEKRHEQVRQAEQRARQDPMNEQLQGAFYSMLGQSLQNQLQPQHPADAIRGAKEMVDQVSQWTGGGQQSFQERRLEKLDNMALQKMHMEYQDKQEDRAHRDKAFTEYYPAIANQVLQGLANLASNFGFHATGGGPGLVGPEAMAAAQQAGRSA